MYAAQPPPPRRPYRPSGAVVPPPRSPAYLSRPLPPMPSSRRRDENVDAI
jgi:hypothetical protein